MSRTRTPTFEASPPRSMSAATHGACTERLPVPHTAPLPGLVAPQPDGLKDVRATYFGRLSGRPNRNRSPEPWGNVLTSQPTPQSASPPKKLPTNLRADSARQGKADPESPRQPRPATTAPPLEPEDTEGTLYQFKLPVNHDYSENIQEKHFDYVLNTVCSWDKGAGEHDLSHLASNMSFNRLYYTWKLKRKEASPMLEFTTTTWERFKADKSVAIEDLILWASTIAPRSVHDYKPMLVLVQNVLRIALEKELDFFSEDLLSFKRRLQVETAKNEELEAENRRLKTEMGLNAVAKLGRSMSIFHQQKKQEMRLKSQMEMQLTEAELKAEELRRQQLMQQKELMDKLMNQKDSEATDEVDRLKEENERLMQVANGLKTKVKHANEKVKQAEKDAKTLVEQVEQLKADMGGLWDKEAKESLETLDVLFNESKGIWRAAQDSKELRMLTEVVRDHVQIRYGGHVELLQVAYNPFMDLDGVDDPDTYNDNFLEVVVSDNPDRIGKRLLPLNAPHLFQCANERADVELEPKIAHKGGLPPIGATGGQGITLQSLAKEKSKSQEEWVFAAPLLLEPIREGGPPEVWGCLEIRASGQEERVGENGAKLREVLKVVREGLTRVTWQLRQNDMALMEEIKKKQAQTHWQLLKEKQSEKLGRLMKQGDKFWQLQQHLAARQRRVEEYAILQRTKVMLEDQRAALDRILDKEASKTALSHIRNYRTPTWNIIAIVIALYVYMGYDSIWKILPYDEKEKIRYVPEDYEEHQALWTRACATVSFDRLINDMQSFDVAKATPNGPHATWETLPDGTRVNISRQKVDTANSLLGKVPQVAAQRASMAAGLAHQWVTQMMLLVKCNEKLVKVEKEMEETLGGIPDELQDEDQAKTAGLLIMRPAGATAAAAFTRKGGLSGKHGSGNPFKKKG